MGQEASQNWEPAGECFGFAALAQESAGHPLKPLRFEVAALQEAMPRRPLPGLRPAAANEDKMAPPPEQCR